MIKQPIKTVALCSTARFVEEHIIKQAEDWLISNHFKVIRADNLNLKHHQFGGHDKDRTKAFQNLLDNKNVDAIWCLRGGYGTVRIMDNLNWATFKEYPKLLLGFSDFTILLNHVLQFGTSSIHAPMPIQFPTLENVCKQTLAQLLKGEYNPISWKKDKDSSTTTISGKLIGGNLSMLYSFMGSDSYPDTQNSILFLEDLDEYSYHLDRMMYGLLRSRALNGIKAILVGSFTSIHDHDTPFGETYKDILIKFARKLNIPIYFNFPAGHIDHNLPIVLGKPISITVDKENYITLEYHEQS